MNQDFKSIIIDELTKDPMCKVNTLGTQYTVRCPYCNDKYSTDHGHFSLMIDTESDTPILYRCLKCPVSGILDKDTILDLELSIENDIVDKMRSFNRKTIKKNNLIVGSESFITPIFGNVYSNTSKLQYINERLGTTISIEEAKNFKIVLNLLEFIKFNEIKVIPGFDPRYLELLSNNYVGFLTSNNNTIVMRSISENKKLKRYVKVLINPKNINANSFYNIPNKFDLLYTNSINIHITEGIFDILGVFFNVRESNLSNNFYYASCGFTYGTILKSLINNGVNTGLHVHIYADNDKSDNEHKRILRRLDILPSIDSVTFHRNIFKDQKDYGVRKELIVDKEFTIKV